MSDANYDIEGMYDDNEENYFDQELMEELWWRRTEMTEMKEDIKRIGKERDEANSLVCSILSEINCRIEHGADSNGHLEGLYGLYYKEARNG
jgi:hypothetical protein